MKPQVSGKAYLLVIVVESKLRERVSQKENKRKRQSEREQGHQVMLCIERCKWRLVMAMAHSFDGLSHLLA